MNLLIISNRVLSRTDNNGKTLLSLISNVKDTNVSQLYFYGNMPEIEGIRYFQLSDGDIIKGKIKRSKRGRAVEPIQLSAPSEIAVNNATINKRYIKRNSLTLLVRELLWKNSWRSLQLEEWLDKQKPDAIFFMAGDCIYAYDICKWIKSKYETRLFAYVTDDYILKRKSENCLDIIHRKGVYRSLKECASNSEVFFTICERMRTVYKHKFDIDSEILFNRCESLLDKQISSQKKNTKEKIFLYAGSLYYGREKILTELSRIIAEINEENSGNEKAILHIYSNERPVDEVINKIENSKGGIYKGSLNSEELKVKLNQCDYPVFVESFEDEQVEKTRLSFSTKIPEYLSLNKLIVAIGPENIGSMDSLSKVSLCINDISNLKNTIRQLLNGVYDEQYYAKASFKEYLNLKNLKGFEEYLESR